MRKIIFIALILFGVVVSVDGVYAACTYDCGPCYQDQMLCTSQGFFCDYSSCPPYDVTFCYDYFTSCPGAPTPTGGLTSCGPGEYGCNVNSQPGFCCPVGIIPTPEPTSTGGGSCTPNCSFPYCGWKDDGCGAICPTCNECELCTIKCGQAKDCGGTCANTDNGAPPQMTIVSPNGSAAAPTLTADTTPHLSWNSLLATTTADRYYLELLNSSGGIIWSRYVNSIGVTGVDTGVVLAPGIYHWHIRGENVDCGTDAGTWSAWGYLKLNTPPSLATPNGLVLKNNAAGVTVPWDPGNMNHICNTGFSSASQPRTVTFQATVSDADGYTDISTVKMRWNGITYNMALGAGSGLTRIATVTVNYAVGTSIVSSALPISFDVKDTLTVSDPIAWVASGYSWKVWDCNVPVSGTVYDSSDSPLGANCATGVGYTTLASADMNFNYATFVPTSGGTLTVNATSDSTYSGANLVWGKIYTSSPNPDLVAGVSASRWVDVGDGTITCGNQTTLDLAVINPYLVSPVLNVDFAAAGGQEQWFQVENGGIQAMGTVSDRVPTTCAWDASCVSAMAITNNGMIAAPTIENSGCVLGDAGCQYGDPNDWYREASTLSSAEKFNYRSFYEKYFLSYGSGITMPGDSTMTDINAAGGKGVFFIDGDLLVDQDNTVVEGDSLFVVVSGQINFDESVSQSQGIFIADGGMVAGGTSSSMLIISGSLYSASSSGDILFSRDYTNPMDNNANPAVLVSYRSDFLFNLPGPLLKVLSGWRQN